MAAYDIFTMIDNMLTPPLIELTDNIYCILDAQLKELYTLYTSFMATLCHCPRFIITGYKKPITEHNVKIVLKPCKTERKKGKY
ncbi:hypothetical protein [Bartonella krasnovii]|uniref:hypothetical protein n=1 Tax=Bartonella krasnovii TaxID=2267275 RepID=UPI001F4CA61A|nr:hypothetical protein [Bartonella krasnovii]UNF35260.1 hypothetical protein MNL12_06695 [Bartonella krasnovii]UNF38574.1 hypothetical protein MNL10_07560 [Bartonella krasnovii]UNF50114.1 hypothetical protein MNL03_07505 [Bartonella krasnovii]